MDELLDQVEQFARNAHEGQRRRFENAEYIVHPIRVMKLCRSYTEDPVILAAALLHDVLEDTEIRNHELLIFLRSAADERMATRIHQVVVELTDIYTKNNYPGMNRRTRKRNEAVRLSSTGFEAQTVKYADIIDNSLSLDDPDFATVYLAEARSLLQLIDKGHHNLHKRAMETVRKIRPVV